MTYYFLWTICCDYKLVWYIFSKIHLLKYISLKNFVCFIYLALSMLLRQICLYWFKEFKVPRDAANGGDLNFSTYTELEEAFSKQELHPGDLKTAVETYINKLLAPIQKIFEKPELKKLIVQAYPAQKKQSKYDKPHKNQIFNMYIKKQ